MFQTIQRWKTEIRGKWKQEYSRLWYRSYLTSRSIASFLNLHRAISQAILFFLVILGTSLFIPSLQSDVEPHFSSEKSLAALQTLIVTVGGALMGAAAITFSIIMVAMQVNVERMPHGLFRKLSADRKLLSAFWGVFLLAAAIATLSLGITTSRVAAIGFAATWGTFLILVLFAYAYRRALYLVNPLQQIEFVIAGAQRNFNMWIRRAIRATPLLEAKTKVPSDTENINFDTARFTFFGINPAWTSEARRAITYAVSLGRRYAERGDYEISASATNAIVRISAAYVHAKGRTFLPHHPFVDVDNTDGFINETLEHLRQTLLIAGKRGDETQIEQTLRGLAALVPVYGGIDYSAKDSEKFHARLAAGYLNSAAEPILPLKMPDVLIEWVRLIGSTAKYFVVNTDPNDSTPLMGKLGLVGGACAVSEHYRAVSNAGVDALARLTIDIFRVRTHDTHFALSTVVQNIAFIAEKTLSVPDSPLENVHRYFLAPYFSRTTSDAFVQWLATLANAVIAEESDSENAKIVLRNIEGWSGELHGVTKKLLLLAIEKHSSLLFDLLHWVEHVANVLLALSTANSCKEYARKKLQEHALSLTYVLSWIPDDMTAIQRVENCMMTEMLFEMSLRAHGQGREDISIKTTTVFRDWVFKAGKHHSGWGILERGLAGLAVLAIMSGGSPYADSLKQSVTKYISGEGAPDQEMRDLAARALREKATSVHVREFNLSRIDSAFQQLSGEPLKALIHELADILSPRTSGESIDVDLF